MSDKGSALVSFHINLVELDFHSLQATAVAVYLTIPHIFLTLSPFFIYGVETLTRLPHEFTKVHHHYDWASEFLVGE